MILRPSSAHRWGPGRCPGSAALEALYPPDEDSPSAREGNAGHFYATERVQGRLWPTGTLAPNGHPVDQDMIEGGDLFYEVVTGYLRECSPTAALHVERKFTMHGLVHPLNEGTPDVLIVDAAAHRIICVDYKYGHRFVEVFRNMQLIDYVAGGWEAYELELKDVKGWEVVCVIVQPRYFGGEQVRTWKLLGWQMWQEIEALSKGAEIAASPDAPTLTGDHCRDCLAAHACGALQRVGGDAMAVAGKSTPALQTDADAALELRQLYIADKRLTARRVALEEVVRAKVQQGANLPYWNVERTMGRKKWVKPIPEVIALGEIMGVDVKKPPDAITPAQAIKAGLPAALVDGYAQAQPGEAKLILLDENAMAKRFAAS